MDTAVVRVTRVVGAVVEVIARVIQTGALAVGASVQHGADVAVVANRTVGRGSGSTRAGGRIADVHFALAHAILGAGYHRGRVYRTQVGLAHQGAVAQVSVFQIRTVGVGFARALVVPGLAHATGALVAHRTGGAITASRAVGRRNHGALAGVRIAGVGQALGVQGVVAQNLHMLLDNAETFVAAEHRVEAAPIVGLFPAVRVNIARTLAVGARTDATLAVVFAGTVIAVVAHGVIVRERTAQRRVTTIVGALVEVVARERQPVATGTGHTVGLKGTLIVVITGSVVLGIPEDTFVRYRVTQGDLAHILVGELAHTVEVGFATFSHVIDSEFGLAFDLVDHFVAPSSFRR